MDRGEWLSINPVRHRLDHSGQGEQAGHPPHLRTGHELQRKIFRYFQEALNTFLCLLLTLADLIQVLVCGLWTVQNTVLVRRLVPDFHFNFRHGFQCTIQNSRNCLANSAGGSTSKYDCSISVRHRKNCFICISNAFTCGLIQKVGGQFYFEPIKSN